MHTKQTNKQEERERSREELLPRQDGRCEIDLDEKIDSEWKQRRAELKRLSAIAEKCASGVNKRGRVVFMGARH